MGSLFENLVVRDIWVFADAHGGQVFSYRDESGLEADAVVEASDGRWAALEVKLGSAQIEEAAQNLSGSKERIDTAVAGEPVALVVMAGSGYDYTRPDGISVIRIGAA